MGRKTIIIWVLWGYTFINVYSQAYFRVFTNIKIIDQAKFCKLWEGLYLHRGNSAAKWFVKYCSSSRRYLFPSSLPPPPPGSLWPLSSITIHSPSCLSLLCQCPRQPIRSCQGTGASVSNLEQINNEGLTASMVVRFNSRHVEAKPKDGNNWANVPLMLIVSCTARLSCSKGREKQWSGGIGVTYALPRAIGYQQKFSNATQSSAS